MTINASQDDNHAYSKIGGAFDNLSDAYTYVAKFLSTADDSKDPLTNTGRMSKYLKVTGKAQKAYSYVRKIQDTMDEKKRDGALLKLGLKISMDIAAKVLGTSLTTHPYYAYHKAMMDALADALNASRNSNAAVDSFRTAVSEANSKAVADAFKQLESRKVDLVAQRMLFRDKAAIAMDIARGMMSVDYAKKITAQYGQSELQGALEDMEHWRANWAGLSFDANKLHIMTGNQINLAAAAMARVQDLVKTMMGGSNTNRVAGYAAVNNIEWEKYDQIVNQKKPDLALIDPVKFAQLNADKAKAWAEAFADMCDLCRSEDVMWSKKFNDQLEKLNKVLYG